MFCADPALYPPSTDGGTKGLWHECSGFEDPLSDLQIALACVDLTRSRLSAGVIFEPN